MKQPEPEAARIAAALELYVSGSLNVFNHRTNVELNNRLVCFDIKQLGKQLKKLGMLIVQDQVWNRVTVNRAERKSTRYFMDEFHLLLKEEQTAAYSVEIWKRFRKWGGIPTAITQNVKDLLASREVENIFELVKGGFAERKGKQLIPTQNGAALISVLPDMLTSPQLTAEWETI